MVKSLSTTLEAKGLRCPLPLLKLKQWIAKASIGDQVRLIVDDPQSIDDVPKWVVTTAHQLDAIEHQQGFVEIRVTKQND